jgi:light-regulated signal transduction histidine kinase (bacteriophytochrome)
VGSAPHRWPQLVCPVARQTRQRISFAATAPHRSGQTTAKFAAPDSYTPKYLAEKILTSKTALEGERKQVTVLFCDLVGSTGLAERIGAERMHGVVNRALKFTPEGGRIDVGAGLHDEVAEVSVADTGIGIASADQEAVFEEFRQVGTADKKAEGTGLGLALSRKFIELHGGNIWVQSQLGAGSTFTFTLPRRQ